MKIKSYSSSGLSGSGTPGTNTKPKIAQVSPTTDKVPGAFPSMTEDWNEGDEWDEEEGEESEEEDEIASDYKIDALVKALNGIEDGINRVYNLLDARLK